MFAWTLRSARHIPLGEPSPLLTHIAGEFAGQIAGLWPAPHAVFLTTDAPRRHLVCLSLAHGADPHPVAETILHGEFRQAIAAAAPDAPAGLRRALTRMGEAAWPQRAYLDLLNLLADEAAAKVLRHAQSLSPALIGALRALPAPLRPAAGGRLSLSLDQARLASEVHAAIAARDGEAAALRACRRWADAASAGAAFALMQEDLTPEPPPPPFVGTARLRPLATQADMRDAALRYRNCLREHIAWAGDGMAAYYEWLGEPRAVVQVMRDRLFGWRLAEARLADNEAVPDKTREAICAELRAIGVHVGRADWQIMQALAMATQPEFALPPVDEALASLFTP